MVTTDQWEGLRGNAPYLETILPFSNILCLQEHWLWHYEQQDTAKVSKGLQLYN
jgi:hypothetical protein